MPHPPYGPRSSESRNLARAETPPYTRLSMENGSTPPSAQAGEASQNGHLPLSARILGVGVQGARAVGKATGIDRAVEVAAEEAIVAAVESEAVERAMARVMRGPILEEAV